MGRNVMFGLVFSFFATAVLVAQVPGEAVPQIAGTGLSGVESGTPAVTAGPFLVPYASGAGSNSDSYEEGVMAAQEEHSAFWWGCGGFVAGGLFSWLGTGMIIVVASVSNPSPVYIPENVDSMSYRFGYRDEGRRKNWRSAAIPGVIMSTLWTVFSISMLMQGY